MASTSGDPYAGAVVFEGWDSIPAGAVAVFDWRAAPWWVRVLVRTPFLDRIAYPWMVRHGLAWLEVFDSTVFDADAARGRGWRILPKGWVAPGSIAGLGEQPEGPVR